MPIKPEFLGLYLLLLRSRIIAWRVISVLFLMIFIGFLVYLIKVDRELRALSEGAKVQCPEHAIAKVVENGKVTCVLRRLGVGERTYRKEMSK